MYLLSYFVLITVREVKRVAVGGCSLYVTEIKVELSLGSRCDGEMLIQERIFAVHEGPQHASWGSARD